MEVFRDVAFPNTIDIVIFQIGQVAVSKSVPETEEVIGQNIVAFCAAVFLLVACKGRGFLFHNGNLDQVLEIDAELALFQLRFAQDLAE